MCIDCLKGYVTSHARGQDFTGEIYCPNSIGDLLGGCDSKPYPHKALAIRLTDEAFGEYIQGQKRLAERAMLQSIKEHKNEEKAANKNVSPIELAVQQAVQTIREDMLNLKCPRCDKVFIEFTDCFALECHDKQFCGCFFCATCLHDCGNTMPEAHQHVLKCRGALFGDEAGTQFRHETRARQLPMIQDYLKGFSDEIQTKILEVCGEDLKGAGLWPIF